MRINLSQGLRLQKRTKEMIGRLTRNIQSGNSIVAGGDRDFDILKALELREKVKMYLVDLKIHLQEASRPIQRDILLVSEMKDELTFYQNIDVNHGKVLNTDYRYGNAPTELTREAIIRKGTVEKNSLKIQAHLDELYSKIDAFNA